MASPLSSSKTTNSPVQTGMLALLHRELTADRRQPDKVHMSSRDLANTLNMLRTLLENGMPLQKALSALAADPSLRKHGKLLKRLANRLVEGSAFHQAIAAFPTAFPTHVVQQIKLGEASGNLTTALVRITEQIEGWLTIRNNLFQKLSYPALVILAGSGLMGFMLTVVVPQFETIYAESNVELPWVTSVVTGLSRALGSYFWLAPFPLLIGICIFLYIRRNREARRKFDKLITQVPILGAFIRDIAVIQFLRSVHALSEAGFVPIDALSQACHTVTNRHVRAELEKLAVALAQGGKLSTAMNHIEHLIPNSVRQLIMVGEHSGNITRSCEGSCKFLEGRLQQRINAMMGLIEPVLTVSLATCIGWIVLAVYMPMFKMFDVLDH